MRTILSFGSILSLSLAAACGDDGAKPTPDGADTSDTGGGDSNDAADSGGGDTADTSFDVGDGTTDGTRLEGSGVAWTSPLVLCNIWQEGATLDEELAHKVRLTIPAHARHDLDPAALLAAEPPFIDVETGPFAADQHRGAEVVTTTLEDWHIQSNGESDTLFAMLRYDLGDAGWLRVSYSITRGDEGASDTVAAADSPEVMFYWSPKGGDAARYLEACAVPDSFEQAIEVLSGKPTTGAAAHLMRFYRTLHRDIVAGSYAVRLESTEVRLDDGEYYRAWAARGPWAHTYVATHHNWGEATEVDFHKDLGTYQSLFKPLAAGETVFGGGIAKVALDDVGLGDGSFTVTRVDDDGTPSDTEYAVTTGWRRVDSAFLARQLAFTCDGGTVGAVGFGEHVAQLMFCPADGATPKRLVGVVPVVWHAAPDQVGALVEGDAIVKKAGPGWTVAVGPTTLDIAPQAGEAFIIDVLDAGGTSVGQSYSELFQLAPMGGWDAPIDSSATVNDKLLRVEVDRRWAAMGIGESSIFGIASVRFTYGDEHWSVDAWDRIAYANTHHNWNDTLDATTDDGHVLHWKITYDFENGEGLTERAWISDADGELFPPTVVVPAATNGE